MQSKAPNRNRFWADLIVEELVRSGVTTFFASPGSRSTPLVTAVFDHPKCHLTMHFDERGSAFLALGYGKATGKPAAWITTSGTAVANGLPAVIEADLESTPLILLTADRPPELRDSDANQAIDQNHIFGHSVRWFFDMPAPTDDIDPTFVLTTIDQAVFRSKTGPVHVNCMFREPLALSQEAYSAIRTTRFEQWELEDAPFTTYSSNHSNADHLSLLGTLTATSSRILLVLGRLSGDGLDIAAAANTICNQIGAVFSVDISSQARLGTARHLGSSGHGIAHLDSLLASEVVRDLCPDVVIQFGASPLSKKLARQLAERQPSKYVVIDHRKRRIDSSHQTTHRIESDPVSLLMDWAQDGRRNASSESKHFSPWQSAWAALKPITASWLREEVQNGPLTEQASATVLSRLIPSSCALTLGSSNPVRHMDSFADLHGEMVSVLTNRGASGIDGTVASAIGFAIGLKKRPVVFLGDLALLHDLNSLAMCASAGAVVVVLNNDGGGIFSYLPIRQAEHLFEPLFGTPHGFGFRSAAEMFHLNYSNPATISALESELERVFSNAEGAIVEIITDRDENLSEAKRLSSALNQRIMAAVRPANR
ncbi:MAG: 2-succinyl-5-enolpyruvyl-6-hydroxy-3-cyclohexene-1-carboxylic-acid synthase [Bacteroidetes bacterium]|nr:2-succinyl-5-enolpyruvyl-6-hydroxy-3-cyclohexene-1-carboxylic-acid synthase [Bacteroidota bacterium]